MPDNIHWLKREELVPAATGKISHTGVVLDIGCGIYPQRYIVPQAHVCCEPYGEYVEHLQRNIKDSSDRGYVVLKMDWEEAVSRFPEKSVDTVFLIDVVEHLPKEAGSKLLGKTVKLARRQVVIFSPIGYHEQKTRDGKDTWGLNGAQWQQHRSGWTPDDFGADWEVYACKDYHHKDNLDNPVAEPFGAFWAIWSCPANEDIGAERLVSSAAGKTEKLANTISGLARAADINRDMLSELGIIKSKLESGLAARSLLEQEKTGLLAALDDIKKHAANLEEAKAYLSGKLADDTKRLESEKTALVLALEDIKKHSANLEDVKNLTAKKLEQEISKHQADSESLNAQITNLNESLKNSQSRYAETESALKSLKANYSALLASRSFRFGYAVLHPVQFVKKIFS